MRIGFLCAQPRARRLGSGRRIVALHLGWAELSDRALGGHPRRSGEHYCPLSATNRTAPLVGQSLHVPAKDRRTRYGTRRRAHAHGRSFPIAARAAVVGRSASYFRAQGGGLAADRGPAIRGQDARPRRFSERRQNILDRLFACEEWRFDFAARIFRHRAQATATTGPRPSRSRHGAGGACAARAGRKKRQQRASGPRTVRTGPPRQARSSEAVPTQSDGGPRDAGPRDRIIAVSRSSGIGTERGRRRGGLARQAGGRENQWAADPSGGQKEGRMLADLRPMAQNGIYRPRETRCEPWIEKCPPPAPHHNRCRRSSDIGFRVALLDWWNFRGRIRRARKISALLD